MAKIRFTEDRIDFIDPNFVGRFAGSAILTGAAVIAMDVAQWHPLAYPLIAVAALPFLFQDRVSIYPGQDRIERRSGFRAKKLQAGSLDIISVITLNHEFPILSGNIKIKDYIATIRFVDDKWPPFEYLRDPMSGRVLPITKLISTLIEVPVSVQEDLISKYIDVPLPTGVHEYLTQPERSDKLPLYLIRADRRFASNL